MLYRWYVQVCIALSVATWNQHLVAHTQVRRRHNCARPHCYTVRRGEDTSTRSLAAHHEVDIAVQIAIGTQAIIEVWPVVMCLHGVVLLAIYNLCPTAGMFKCVAHAKESTNSEASNLPPKLREII